MPRKTSFNDSWLKENVKDDNGDIISDWCIKAKDMYSAHCKICHKSFSISNMGIKGLMAHANGVKHKDNVRQLKGQAVFKVVSQECLHINPIEDKINDNADKEASQSTDVSLVSGSLMIQFGKSRDKQWIPINLDDKVKKAEILLALKLVASNYSFNSFSDLSDILKVGFTDSDIAQHIKLGATKVSYLVVHGMAPFFSSAFLNECRTGTGYFTIYFDETTTRQVKKQLDIHIGFWSTQWKRVLTVYIDSTFLGHAEADKLENAILEFMEKHSLDPHKLLQCSMDGPTVNLAFLKKINENFSSKGIQPLVDIGTCSLHPMHTAFTKGIETLPFDIEQFANDIYSWFKLSAARRQDFNQVQYEELMESAGEFFLRPVSSRWLSMEPVCRRLIEQFAALKKYFLVSLPASKNSASVCSGEKYKHIRKTLQEPITLIYLNYIAFFASSFSGFLKLFQKLEPLAHILYEKLNEQVRLLMLQFITAEVVANKEGSTLQQVDCNKSENWLPTQSIDIGIGTRKAIAEVEKLNDEKKKELLLAFRRCVKEATCYLQSRLPLSNAVLRDMQSLHPLSRKTEQGRSAMSRLCLHLRKVTKTDAFCDSVQREYLMYMCDNDQVLEDWMTTKNCNDICAYWNYVSQIDDGNGTKKYLSLSFVAKCALALSHINAVPERGFSVNNSLLAKDRLLLDENTIIGVRVVKEAVRIYGSVTQIPITKELVLSAKRAHAEYLVSLEREKRLAILEEEQRKQLEASNAEKRETEKKRQQVADEIQEKEKDEQSYLQEEETAKELIADASKKLGEAVQENNLKSVRLAHMMLASGNEKLQLLSQKLKKIRDEKKTLLLKKEKINEKQNKATGEFTTQKRKASSTSTANEAISESAKKRKTQEVKNRDNGTTAGGEPTTKKKRPEDMKSKENKNKKLGEPAPEEMN